MQTGGWRHLVGGNRASALSLDAGRTVILNRTVMLNQNEANPLDIEQPRAFGGVHGYVPRFSG